MREALGRPEPGAPRRRWAHLAQRGAAPGSLCHQADLTVFVTQPDVVFLSTSGGSSQIVSGSLGQWDRDFKCLNICMLIKIDTKVTVWQLTTTGSFIFNQYNYDCGHNIPLCVLKGRDC